MHWGGTPARWGRVWPPLRPDGRMHVHRHYWGPRRGRHAGFGRGMGPPPGLEPLSPHSRPPAPPLRPARPQSALDTHGRPFGGRWRRPWSRGERDRGPHRAPPPGGCARRRRTSARPPSGLSVKPFASHRARAREVEAPRGGGAVPANAPRAAAPPPKADTHPSAPFPSPRDSIIYQASCPRLGPVPVAVKVYELAALSASKLRAVRREAAGEPSDDRTKH